jgi:hypothetical protein
MKDFSEDLRLRKEVRHLEDVVNQMRIDVELPSEDAIMDQPGHYRASMRKTIKRLNKHIATTQMLAKTVSVYRRW